MSFFGLTVLGTNPFASASLAGSEALGFVEIPDEKFSAAFDAVDVTRAGLIPRAMLADVWADAAGRELTSDEKEACRTTCHTDVSGMIARREYMESVALMRARLSEESVRPSAKHISCGKLLGERRRHMRPEDDPQQMCERAESAPRKEATRASRGALPKSAPASWRTPAFPRASDARRPSQR